MKTNRLGEWRANPEKIHRASKIRNPGREGEAAPILGTRES